MTRMWRGPCDALKAASSDPLWAAIHRRGGRLGVFCNVTHDGKLASFFSVEKIRGEYYQRDIGQARSDGDPYFAVLAGFRQFTPLDPELIALNASYIGRLADEIESDCHMLAVKLDKAVDAYCE